MLHILMTFDYELYFNKSFSNEKDILIDSTYEIVETLDKLHIKGSFFVDSPCLLRYEKFGLNDFTKLAEKQIKDLIKDGHDVQLHIHPSWFTAERNSDGEWVFDENSYSLDKFRNYNDLIKISKDKLDSITSELDYKCFAYRAGGFCLNPEIPILINLKKLGILFDSSVCCGLKMSSRAQTFDWSRFSNNNQWFFNPYEGLDFKKINNLNQGMMEIPIGTYKKIPNKWVLTHFEPCLHYPPLKGIPSPVEPLTPDNRIQRLIKRLDASCHTPILFVLDNLHANALFYLAKYFYKQSLKINKDIYICAIGHPKFASHESIENMSKFVKKTKEYSEKIDFITFSDVREMLMN